MEFSTKDYVELNLEFILYRTSALDVFKYYIPEFKSPGKKFSSPFRSDVDPSCAIKDYGSTAILTDFATGESYSFIKLVQTLYGCDYYTAIRKIAGDLNLIDTKINPKLVTQYESKSREIVESPGARILIHARDWNIVLDKPYWKQYGISLKTLRKYKVFPISTFWINSIRFDCKKLTYAYYYGNYTFKIMSPYSKENKWYSNTKSDIIQGFNQLPESGDLLIITKGLKDVMLLYELGYTAIAFSSETTLISDSQFTTLQSRFKKLVLFYDNDGTFTPTPDEPGKGKFGAFKNSIKHKIPMIFLPDGEEKDISDYYKKYGLLETQNIMKKLIENVRWA